MITQNGIQFETVDISTEEGIKKAERLKQDGWVMGDFGFYKIHFWRKASKETVTK